MVHLPDVQQDAEFNQPLAAAFRGRSALGVPLLRDGQPIGAIVVGRSESHPFSDRQIALLQTFADQAVIAIENVRLFKELEARNRGLTDALERQTATADVLRVIAQSPNDLQPVFDTILQVRSASAGPSMASYGGSPMASGASFLRWRHVTRMGSDCTGHSGRAPNA